MQKSKPSDLKVSGLLERYPILSEISTQILDALSLIIQTYEHGGKILAMGNGGSSADAEHMCGELMKGFKLQRHLTAREQNLFSENPVLASKLQRALPAISLGVGHSMISAFANDVDYDFVYAQQVWALARPEDLVFAISTSGNSKNVVWGLKTAKAMGVRSVALTGSNESACSKLADVCIRAPMKDVHIIQELHLPIYHALCLELEYYFFGSDEK